MTTRADIARNLLRRVRLDWMIGPDGRPVDQAWDRVPTLSSGELAMVEVAFLIIDFSVADESTVPMRQLLKLDLDNLRAVGAALQAWADL